MGTAKIGVLTKKPEILGKTIFLAQSVARVQLRTLSFRFNLTERTFLGQVQF